MSVLRHAPFAARFVLVWFALFLGVSIAAPLVHPQVMQMVCTASGAMELVGTADTGGTHVGSHAIDCPLCLDMDAPPPVLWLADLPRNPRNAVLQAHTPSPVGSIDVAPYPARGPPPRRG